MTVAFGTSTPTSITVVETSTSTSPRRNASIASSFWEALILPVRSPTRSPFSTRCDSSRYVASAEWILVAPEREASGTSSSSEPSSFSSMSGHTT